MWYGCLFYPKMHQIENADSNFNPNRRSQLRSVFAEIYEIGLRQIPFVVFVIGLRGRCLFLHSDTLYRADSQK